MAAGCGSRRGRLGISRTPVREAILLLQREGFVEGHAELVELIRRGDVEAARQRHYAEWVRAGEELMAAVTRCGLKCL